MAKAKLYSQDGQEKGEVTLNKEIFEAKINDDLMHQAVVMIQANRRRPIAHTKIRGEVRTTTAKPFKQKGTGRARQGSTKNVHHRGGCVVFGPRNDRNFGKNMPKKQKRSALFSALSTKAKSGDILALEKYDKEPKTKLMAELIAKLPIEKTLLIVTPAADKTVYRAASNLPRTETIEARNLNVEKVLKYKNIMFLQDAFKALEDVFLGSAKVETIEEEPKE